MDSMKSQANFPLLKVENLSVRFGYLKAVSGLELQINEGELFGLIGPNGAGKTTVFNAITGSVPLSSGKIIFEGEIISGLKTSQISERGIVRIFQSAAIFPKTPVGMHIMTGFHCRTRSKLWDVVLRTPLSRREENENRIKMLELLHLAGLEGYEEQSAADLTWAQQKRLMIATALATRPKMILLDEPVAGMNSEEIQEIISMIDNILRGGTTVFIIDHNIKVMMLICNRIMVMNAGQNLMEGSPEEVAKDPRVIEAYLGYKNT